MRKTAITATAAVALAAGGVVMPTVAEIGDGCEAHEVNLCAIRAPDSHHTDFEKSREGSAGAPAVGFAGGMAGSASIIEGADRVAASGTSA